MSMMRFETNNLACVGNIYLFLLAIRDEAKSINNIKVFPTSFCSSLWINT